MKKIGIVISGKEDSGGLSQYSWSLIDALKNDQFNRYIIFCEKENMVVRNSNVFEVRLISKEFNLLNKIIIFFSYLFVIRSKIIFSKKSLTIFSDIDYFIVPSASGYPHFFLGKPFVFTLHDLQDRYFPEYFSKIQIFLRRIMHRALSMRASKILCESIFVKNDIIKFLKIDTNKIHIVPGPAPKSLINFKINLSKLDIIKKKYNIQNKFIFYPAQTWKHKNHIRLIDAFEVVSSKFNDVDLVLTGAPKSNHSRVIDKIANSKISSRIKYLGYADYSELPYLYKASEFLVMPSLFESISIPIYESFSLKVPVMCSNITSIPEQVGDAALIFDPWDIKDISDKMIMYLNNQDLKEEMGLKGYKKIQNLNHYDYCKRLINIFNS